MKVIFLAIALLIPTALLAGPDVNVSIIVEKEAVVTEAGKEVKKRVQVSTASPGETLIYTLNFENKGDEEATNVELVDPIPEGMTYINGSAFGPGSDITFSIDNGKTYKKPSLLTYVVKGESHVASPDDYSHIRWIVKRLDPGKSGVAGFKALVK